jgi:hypothetical protein
MRAVNRSPASRPAAPWTGGRGRSARRIAIFIVGAILSLLAWQRQRAAQEIPGGAIGSGPARASRYDLGADEELGGHTLARHVGRSPLELAARLAREAGVSAASSFIDRATAEAVVGATLAREQGPIASWLRRDKENLSLDYPGESGRTIGEVLLRGESAPRQAHAARIVLRRRDGRFFVLTAYPVEP